MRKLLFLLILVLLFVMGNLTIFAQAEPENIVTNLYRVGKVKDVGSMNKTELQKYFSTAIVKKILAAQKWESGLNFDVLYEAQDTKITSFKISKFDGISENKGTVNVDFKNFGEKKRIAFYLENFSNGWKIYDIAYEGIDQTFKDIL